MYKKAISSLFSLCLQIGCVSISFGAEVDQQEVRPHIPTGRLLKWSTFHGKYKSVNGVDPEFVFNPNQGNKTFSAWLCYDVSKNRIFLQEHPIHTGRVDTEREIRVDSVSPSSLQSLQFTRCHGQSEGNICAIDNFGNWYTITYVDIDWKNIKKKSVMVHQHNHQIPSGAIVHKAATLRVDSWPNRFEKIYYTKICGDQEKEATKWFRKGCLDISDDNIQKIDGCKKSDTSFFMQIIDPYDSNKKTFFEIVRVTGDGDILEYNLSGKAYDSNRLIVEQKKEIKNNYAGYILAFKRILYHPATLFVGTGVLFVLLAYRKGYSFSDIIGLK